MAVHQPPPPLVTPEQFAHPQRLTIVVALGADPVSECVGYELGEGLEREAAEP